MNEKKTYTEPSIKLMDLIYSIVKYWRSIVICMIVLGTLFGGLSYYKSMKNIESSENQKKRIQTVDDYMDSLNLNAESRQRISDVLNVVNDYQRQYDQIAEYRKNSVIMNLNPNSVPTANIRYFVDNHFSIEYPEIYKENNLSEITSTIASAVVEGDVQENLKDIIDENDLNYSNQIIQMESSEEGYLCAKIQYYNEESVQRIAEIVKEEIAQIAREKKRLFGDFDIELVEENFSVSADDEILSLQQSVTGNMSALIDLINKEKNKLTTEDKEALEKVIYFQGQEVSDISVDEVTPKPSVSKKYILVGAIFGAFLICFVALFHFLFMGKVRSENDFTNHGVAAIGTYYQQESKRKLLGFIDYMLRTICGKNNKTEDIKTKQILSRAIMAKLDMISCEKVRIVSSLSQDEVKNLTDFMKTHLGKKQIEYCFDAMKNEELFAQLLESEAVVMIEKVGKSSLKDTEKLISICNEYKANILGVILQEEVK